MKDATIQQIVETLQEDVNLNKATPAALSELAQHANRSSFAKGEYVFRTGDDANLYYLVESGRVVLSRESLTGKAFTFLIAERGTPLNAVTCFKPRTRFFSARVAELVGTSRETAARVVSRLQEYGLIEKSRGVIRIISKSRIDDSSTSPFFII